MSFNLKNNNVTVCDFNRNWNKATARILFEEIKKISKKKDVRIMTTAGKASSQLHQRLTRLISDARLKNIKIFLADERCLSKYHHNSNYKVIKKIYSTNRGVYVYKFFYSNFGSEYSLKRYKRYLDINIDMLILGFANDGHIASLFSGRKEIDNYNELLILKKDLELFDRYTINYNFIDRKCKKIYLLVNSVVKKRLFNQISLAGCKLSPLVSLFKKEMI